MSVTCNELGCNIGAWSLESILVALFAKSADGCVGIKLVKLDETNCANLTPLKDCGTIVTAEEAIKAALVDDGCGGLALGYFELSGEQRG